LFAAASRKDSKCCKAIFGKSWKLSGWFCNTLKKGPGEVLGSDPLKEAEEAEEVLGSDPLKEEPGSDPKYSKRRTWV
jgi:hypothetical protein